jgi:NAD(P)-dependent dehydrogenase (short-subunit alcohol dehydrogenase family)
MAGALVTGGTKGIGLECARTLRRLGLPVAICGRDAHDVDAFGAEMELSRVCEVTDRTAVDSFTTEAAEAFDGLAVVVANAGVLSERATLAETTADVWEATMRVNVVGVANTLAAATPHLRRSRGYAFVISSIAGHEGMAEFSPYSSSKWALRGLTLSFLQEEATNGVRATVISPGLVDTRMGDAAGFGGERLRPSDVAATIEWCLALSPASLVREVLLERMAAV